MIHVEPGLFLRYEPAGAPAPLLVDVSRSGREYPPQYRTPLPFTTVHDNVSMYLEDLWASAPALGGTLLYCLFPNTWIDVNRNESDMDPALIDGAWPTELKPTQRTLEGLGLIKTRSRYGEAFQERALTVAEVEERLNHYYRPYHAELERIVAALHARCGVLRQVSCHCMSAVGAPTHPDPGKPRADFCLGDVNGATASRAFVEFVQQAIQSLGYSCTINDPYSGGELNTRFGRPGTVESVMVEINKKLFMDVNTFRRKPEFAKVKADVTKVLRAVTEHARARAAKAA